jgi:hypothetical protein
LVGEGSGNVVQAAMSVLPEEFDVHCHVPNKHWFHVQDRFSKYVEHRQSADVVDAVVRLGNPPAHFCAWLPPINLQEERTETVNKRSKDSQQLANDKAAQQWLNDHAEPSGEPAEYDEECGLGSFTPKKLLWARFSNSYEGATEEEELDRQGLVNASGAEGYPNEVMWEPAEYLVLDTSERGSHRHRTKCCRYYWATHAVMRVRHSALLNDFLETVTDKSGNIDESKLEALQTAATKEILRGEGARGALWATHHVVPHNNLFCTPKLERQLRDLGAELVRLRDARISAGHSVKSKCRWAIQGPDDVHWTADDWSNQDWPVGWLMSNEGRLHQEGQSEGDADEVVKNNQVEHQYLYDNAIEEYRKRMQMRARQVRLLHIVQIVVGWLLAAQ